MKILLTNPLMHDRVASLRLDGGSSIQCKSGPRQATRSCMRGFYGNAFVSNIFAKIHVYVKYTRQRKTGGGGMLYIKRLDLEDDIPEWNEVFVLDAFPI